VNLAPKGNPIPANLNIKGGQAPQAVNKVKVDMYGLDLARLKHAPANIVGERQFLQADKIATFGGKATPVGQFGVMKPTVAPNAGVGRANPVPAPKQSAVAPKSTRQEGVPPQKTAPPVVDKPANNNAAKPAVEKKQHDRNKSAPVDADGKWPQKEGKEWRDKIVGKAQKTGTDGHAFRSNREAVKAAKNEDVEKVYLNRGYKKATGHPIDPNRRPDVTVVKKSGKVDAIEVPSKTDKLKELKLRNEKAMKQLPPEKRGEVKIREIAKEK